MTFEEFIMQAREMNASDIHLTVGAPTVVRVNGELRKYTELSDQVVNRTILSILSAEQEKALNEGKDIDFSFELKNGARQRVNVFRQSGKLAACIRLLNAEIPTLEELKMPSVLLDFAKKRRGLVLVTGPTGAGKSTTLAAMVEYINTTRPCHIITIEDPIEYRYKQEKATIHQRELGILELLLDVFLDSIRVVTDKFDIKHDLLSLLYFGSHGAGKPFPMPFKGGVPP